MSQSWPPQPINRLVIRLISRSVQSINYFAQVVHAHRIQQGLVDHFHNVIVQINHPSIQSSMESQQAAMHSTSAYSRLVTHSLCCIISLSLLLRKLSNCNRRTLFDAHKEGT